jgi:hypothetical protein
MRYLERWCELCGRQIFRKSGVLHLCSVSELGGAQCENLSILNRQNEVQETQYSLFPIYRRLPKLDVAGSTPVSRSKKSTS